LLFIPKLRIGAKRGRRPVTEEAHSLFESLPALCARPDETVDYPFPMSPASVHERHLAAREIIKVED